MAKIEVRIDIDKAKAVRYSQDKLHAGMLRGGSWLEGIVKRSFRPGTGAYYSRGRKLHRASVPGRPPAVDIGLLRASITHEVTREAGEIIGRVGTHVEYAPYLEFGTSRMAARPFLRPALINNKAAIIKQIEFGARAARG